MRDSRSRIAALGASFRANESVIWRAQNRRKFLVEHDFALNWRPPAAD